MVGNNLGLASNYFPGGAHEYVPKTLSFFIELGSRSGSPHGDRALRGPRGARAAPDGPRQSGPRGAGAHHLRRRKLLVVVIIFVIVVVVVSVEAA